MEGYGETREWTIKKMTADCWYWLVSILKSAFLLPFSGKKYWWHMFKLSISVSRLCSTAVVQRRRQPNGQDQTEDGGSLCCSAAGLWKVREVALSPVLWNKNNYTQLLCNWEKWTWNPVWNSCQSHPRLTKVMEKSRMVGEMMGSKG